MSRPHDARSHARDGNRRLRGLEAISRADAASLASLEPDFQKSRGNETRSSNTAHSGEVNKVDVLQSRWRFLVIEHNNLISFRTAVPASGESSEEPRFDSCRKLILR